MVCRCDNIKEPGMSWIPSVAVSYNEKPTVITYSGTLLRLVHELLRLVLVVTWVLGVLVMWRWTSIRGN